jgi:hypothetical protein
VGPLKIILNGIIDGAKDLRVDEFGQKVILFEWLHAGYAPSETFHNLLTRMADGGDRRAGGNNDSSSRHEKRAASFRINPDTPQIP